MQIYSIKHKLPTLTSGQNTFAQNTDPDYFYYDYQSFLDRLNRTMETLLFRIPGAGVGGAHEPVYPFNQHFIPRAIFFKVTDGKIELHVSQHIFSCRLLFRFSANLYKYIGNGFKCKFYDNPEGRGLGFAGGAPVVYPEMNDGSFFIDYNPFVWKHKDTGLPGDLDKRVVVSNPAFWGDPGAISNEIEYITPDRDSAYYLEHDYGAAGAPDVRRVYYYIFKQQYSTLANWNVCKAILICSSSFPIKAEYYPTNKKNIFLTHYKEQWYINFVRQMYGEDALDDKAIFDKASTKILDVYYPLSTEAGDIRSTIIYDNQDIETGNKIDMIGGMDLENFDVVIKWVDIYGNVYDLYLAPGCSVNIRLCFTRKKIRKDELVAAFGRVSDSLDILTAGKIPQEDNSKTFDLKMEPRRKRNKVELPGVLENGLIMKP